MSFSLSTKPGVAAAGGGGADSGITYVNITLASGANVLASPGGTPANNDRRVYRIKQPAAGAAGTLTLNAIFRLPESVASLSTSTANNKTDLLSVIYDTDSSKWWVTSFTPGY